MLDNIEWIFFDVGSTLVDESIAYQHRIEDAIAGTDITYQQFSVNNAELLSTKPKGRFGNN